MSDAITAIGPLGPDVLAALPALCRRFHVARLDVFGSAATGKFDPNRSDVDFLVLYRPHADSGFLNNHFSLQAALERLVGRSVDLVVANAIENPYFLRRVTREKRLLFEHS